jgi:hypothetical protein
VDRTKVGQGRVERTHPIEFSMDETADVGIDLSSPVSEDYGPTGNGFTGKVTWVQIDIDEAAEDPTTPSTRPSGSTSPWPASSTRRQGVAAPPRTSGPTHRAGRPERCSLERRKLKYYRCKVRLAELLLLDSI